MPGKYWFNFSFAQKTKKKGENPIIRSIVLNISEKKIQSEEKVL